MDKSQELITTTKLVKEILMEDERARNSDLYLYIKICEKINPTVLKKPFSTVMMNLKAYNLPHTESVRRTRQKIQEKHPELAGNRKITQAREENEKAFREYARG